MIDEISDIQIGIRNTYLLNQKVSVCKECGFVFASPTISQLAFNEFYNDEFPYYQPEDTYSVGNRLNVIDKYASREAVIVEVGGNSQGEFKRCISENYKAYYSMDINANANNNVTCIENLPMADVLVTYYVMEHIVELDKFISSCRDRIRESGYLIIEVPDVNMYYRDISGLANTEHVNHFSPYTLSKLVCQYQFELVDIDRRNACRSFGFVAVFKKTEKTVSVEASEIEYILSRNMVVSGFEIRKKFDSKIDKCVECLNEVHANGTGKNCFLGSKCGV